MADITHHWLVPSAPVQPQFLPDLQNLDQPGRGNKPYGLSLCALQGSTQPFTAAELCSHRDLRGAGKGCTWVGLLEEQFELHGFIHLS